MIIMNKSELHIHTAKGSLLDSIIKIDDLVLRAGECNLSSVAQTDHGTMFSTIDFYKAFKNGFKIALKKLCKKKYQVEKSVLNIILKEIPDYSSYLDINKILNTNEILIEYSKKYKDLFNEALNCANIKPIIGLEAYETDNLYLKEKGDKRYHLVLLAKNNDGLKALYKLSSISYINGFYHKPRLDIETIAPYSKNLIVASACLGGRISKMLMSEEENSYDLAKELVYNYKSVFHDFYIELQSHNTEDQVKVNKLLIQLAKDTKTEIIVTSDAHFLTEGDMYAQSQFVKIGQSREVGETYSGCYIKGLEETTSILLKQGIHIKDIEKAISNTIKISDMCNIDIDLKSPNQMPEIACPVGFNNNKGYLKYLINEGFKKRKISQKQYSNKEAIKRIKMEFDVLEFQEYIDYFLLTKGLIDEARRRNIPLGLARGSIAGCYIAYLIGITEVDSITFGLDFSRFANKGRKSLADIDLDISKRYRLEMINIAKSQFNISDDILETKVAPICTFNTLSTKVALRDLGKVLQNTSIEEQEKYQSGGITNTVYDTYLTLDYIVRDEVAKMIPTIKEIDDFGQEIDKEIALSEAIHENPKLLHYKKIYPMWFDLVMKLEGLPKSLGTHAAGVTISPKSINTYAPLCLNGKDGVMVQYEMHNILEDLNLVKMDFLGLDTLDVIDDTLLMIGLTWDDISVDKIDLNDKKVYDNIYKSGNCLGIFQMESQEATRMCVEVKCDNINDVIAVNASNRPGTKEFFPTYVQNKLDPSNVKLLHDDLKPIVALTHGILLYQEQILNVFRLANFPELEVDIARRAIGHKQPEVMATLEEKMFDYTVDGHRYGLLQNGWTKLQVEELWRIIQKQSSYSFNQSHACGYGLLSYITAYLKTYYPTQFMTALLNSEQGNFGQISKYIHECKRMNIKILEPLVNYSEQYFSIKDKDILFGLSMIKGLGDKGVEELLATRPYLSLTDYMEKAKLNCSSTVALIKSGSFKEFEPSKTKVLKVFRELNFDGCKFKEVIKSGSKKDMLELGLIQKEDEFKEKEKCLTIWNNYKRSLFDIKENAKIEKHNEEFNVKYMEGNELDWQMETLSMYLNENPYQNLIDNGTIQPYDNIINLEKGIVVGTILDIKKKNNKKTGRTYAFVDVINHEGQIVECGFWYKGYENYQYLLKRGNKIISTGKKDGKRFFIEECDLYKEWLKKVGTNKKI